MEYYGVDKVGGFSSKIISLTFDGDQDKFTKILVTVPIKNLINTDKNFNATP